MAKTSKLWSQMKAKEFHSQKLKKLEVSLNNGWMEYRMLWEKLSGRFWNKDLQIMQVAKESNGCWLILDKL